MSDLFLHDCAFVQEAAKIKVLVIGVLLADTIRVSRWQVEDYTNDWVFDCLRKDFEQSNPAVFMAGCYNILGSIHVLKTNKPTVCQIRFMLECSPAVNVALRASKLCLQGGNQILWVCMELELV